MNEKYSTETRDAPVGASSWERPTEPLTSSTANAHHVAARGFAQMFALNPVLGVFIITTDVMVSAADVASLGITLPVLWLIASIFTAIVTFMGQRKWGGDSSESAFIKALMVGFLVALPTPFPSFLTVPSAIVGTVQMLRRKD